MSFGGKILELIFDKCVGFVSRNSFKIRTFIRKCSFYIFNRQCNWSSTFKIKQGDSLGEEITLIEEIPNLLSKKYSENFEWINSSSPIIFSLESTIFKISPLFNKNGVFLETMDQNIGFRNTKRIIDEFLPQILETIQSKFKDIDIIYSIKLKIQNGKNPYVANYLQGIKDQQIDSFSCVYRIIKQNNYATITINIDSIQVVSENQSLWRIASLRALSLSIN